MGDATPAARVPRRFLFRHRGRGALLFVAAAFAVAAGGARGQGSTAVVERDLFPIPGVDNTVYATETLDGPSGPALYVGGRFRAAGGVRTSGIALFEGGRFVSLAGGVSGAISPSVSAVAAMSEGSRRVVVAAGRFRFAGGRAANHVARWDGVEWSPLGDGLEADVVDLEVVERATGPTLYAAGSLRLPSGAVVEGVHRWDGERFSVHTPDVAVVDLETFDFGAGPALYAAGTFVNASRVSVNGVVRCDDGAFTPVGEFDGPVNRLAVFDDGFTRSLYACGSFRMAGGVFASYIARFDGRAWSRLPSEPNRPCTALAVADDGRGPALFVGGEFTSAGGVDCLRVARFDGVAWSSLGAGLGSEPSSDATRVNSFTTFDDGAGPEVIAGGYLPDAGGASANHVARWDGVAWTTVPPALDGSISDWLGYDGDLGLVLLAGGSFVRYGNVVLNGVAQWTRARGFEPVGGGLPGPVRVLATHDDGSGPALYAARWENADRLSSVVSRFDGVAWTDLPGSFDDAIHGLVSFDDGSGPALYAGGGFDTQGGVERFGLARWRVGAWEGVGAGLPRGSVRAMTVYDGLGGPALYVGGSFAGTGTPTLWRWDGASWSDLRRPAVASVFALGSIGAALGGPALVAGGADSGVAGAGPVALFDGIAWRDLDGGSPEGLAPSVSRLLVHDFGLEPALYVTGNFSSAGGVPASGFARWDGTGWSAVIDGAIVDSVAALESFTDGLGPAIFLGGSFTSLGDAISRNAGRLGDPVQSCGAGTVNAGRGRIAAVLLVNDSAGGPARTFRFTPNDPIVLYMQVPPATTGTAAFALYGWRRMPGVETVRRLPAGIGYSCLPTPLTEGSPQPLIVWNNTGLPVLGTSTLPSVAAPSIVLQLPNGVGHPASFFLQGIIEDPGSAGLRQASVTNGVRVEVR